MNTIEKVAKKERLEVILSMNKKETIDVVELFAGVGGFRLGLEIASDRFQTICANQWEPSMKEQYAFECYTNHFGNSSNHICEDISKVKCIIPNHDLLVGGFPCQDYSIMKKNSNGIEGNKGKLWWSINDIIQEKRPKYILLENVDRLVWSPAKQYGRDFSIILRCLYELGYAVEWRIINASDYGQAQRRRRTFIFAFYKETDIYQTLAEKLCINGIKSMHKYIVQEGVFAKAFPVKNHSMFFTDNWMDEMKFESIQKLSDNQTVRLYNSGVMMNGRIYSVDVYPQQEHFIPIKEILENTSVDKRFFLKDEDMPKWVYSKSSKRETRIRKDGSKYIFTEGTVKFPDSLNMPARTILTSETKVGRTSHVVKDLHTGRLRTLTPIECERINGFPDNWTNTGMPERMRYFCMGNALVVPLITRMGKILDEILK